MHVRAFPHDLESCKNLGGLWPRRGPGLRSYDKNSLVGADLSRVFLGGPEGFDPGVGPVF